MTRDQNVRSNTPVWLGLLAVSILINYVDRGNLAVAAPLLKEELHLSATQLGVLITAFFWSYTVVLAISGWIVDRFNVNWVLAAGFALWSLATAVTGYVHGFAMLLMLRVLLGAGESVAFPSCSKIIALNVEDRYRGVANAMLITGMGLGPAIGTYACGISMARWGWRPVFIVIGVASLLWLLPWIVAMPKNTAVRRRASEIASSWEILSQRSFWAVSVGHFCVAYPLYFIVVWLPLYLVRERHETMQQMSREAALFYVVFAVLAPVAGWVADTFVRAGRDVTTVRKACVGAGQVLVIGGVLACGVANARVSFAGLMALAAGCGIVAPNVYVFAQLLAGSTVAGKWTGYQSAVANLAGVAVGPITGWIVDRTGTFSSAFTVCAAVSVVGTLCWVLLVPKLRQVEWQTGRGQLKAASELA